MIKALQKKLALKTAVMLVVSIYCISSIGFAAPTTSDTEEQNRRARQEALERKQEQKKDVFLQKETKASDDTTLPEEKLSFPIKELKLEGDMVEQFPWAQKMLSKYTGRNIGLEGVNLIAKRITNAFIDRGYITTRVLIPEQDLSTGTLRFILVPGIIRNIRFADSETKGNWQTAFPAHPGDILNLRNLEQGLEQMKRIPSQDVDMKIVPGDKPGQSDIVITLKRTRPYRLTLSLDDSGTKATGKLQASETFSLDNIVGMNDLFYVTFNSDADREGKTHGTRGDSFYYSFPLGQSTFTISESTYNYHQTIQTTTQSFLSSGESKNTEFRLSQLIYRDQSSKTYLDFSIIKGNSKSFIDDTEIEVQRKITTAEKIGITERQYFGQTSLDAQLAFKRGVPWCGAQPDADLPGQPTTRYKMWTLDATVTTPVNIGKTKARYSANIRGQYTDDILYGTEFFSIGSRYTVRGFDGENTLSAEKGWFWRNELSIPLGQSGTETYVGLDYGQVGGPSAASLPGRILAGSTVGFRGAIKEIQYDLYVGWPLRKPDGLTTATPTFGFQITRQL